MIRPRHEEDALRAVRDAEEYNRRVLIPDKARLNLRYADECSLALDLRCIWATLTGGTIPGYEPSSDAYG